MKTNLFNPFQSSIVFHIKTSHLIGTANQMTGFFMQCNTGLKWIKAYVLIEAIKSMVLIIDFKFMSNFSFEDTVFYYP